MKHDPATYLNPSEVEINNLPRVDPRVVRLCEKPTPFVLIRRRANNKNGCGEIPKMVVFHKGCVVVGAHTNRLRLVSLDDWNDLADYHIISFEHWFSTCAK